MFQAYSNAVLNNTATAALDSRDGLFMDRDPRSLHACELDLDWRPKKIDPYAAPAMYGRFACFDENIREKNVAQSKLNHRAWVGGPLALPSPEL